VKSAPIEVILLLLHRIQQRQPGQWSACCPAHADKAPSLSVRETPEGSVLLHCFAGCSVTEVVAELGLQMSDLFPPRQLCGREPKRTSRLLTAGQALELLDREANLVAVVAANVHRGVKLTQDDLNRITQAAGRINWVRKESMGSSYA